MIIKKLFVFLMVTMVLSIMGVVADTQDTEAIINEAVTILIEPNPLLFGPLVSGTNDNPATNGPISFDATGSNIDVTVTVDSVTGAPFDNGLKFDGLDPVGQVFLLECVVVSDVCTYTPVTTIPTLDIPVGSPVGLQSGVITYIITGPIP